MMKTTFDVSDALVRRARDEAARQGVTLDAWVEDSLAKALPEEDLAPMTARTFAQANRAIWDNPEEDAAWADW